MKEIVCKVVPKKYQKPFIENILFHLLPSVYEKIKNKYDENEIIAAIILEASLIDMIKINEDKLSILTNIKTDKISELVKEIAKIHAEQDKQKLKKIKNPIVCPYCKSRRGKRFDSYPDMSGYFAVCSECKQQWDIPDVLYYLDQFKSKALKEHHSEYDKSIYLIKKCKHCKNKKAAHMKITFHDIEQYICLECGYYPYIEIQLKEIQKMLKKVEERNKIEKPIKCGDNIFEQL